MRRPRIGAHRQRHRRTAGRLADHEPPTGNEPPRRAQLSATIYIGAAGLRVHCRELSARGGVAVGDHRSYRQCQQQAGAGSCGRRCERGEDTSAQHRPQANHHRVPKTQLTAQGDRAIRARHADIVSPRGERLALEAPPRVANDRPACGRTSSTTWSQTTGPAASRRTSSTTWSQTTAQPAPGGRLQPRGRKRPVRPACGVRLQPRSIHRAGFGHRPQDPRGHTDKRLSCRHGAGVSVRVLGYLRARPGQSPTPTPSTPNGWPGPGSAACRRTMPGAWRRCCHCWPTRSDPGILYALDEVEELCVGDLALALSATEDSVGYALKILRTAGLSPLASPAGSCSTAWQRVSRAPARPLLPSAGGDHPAAEDGDDD